MSDPAFTIRALRHENDELRERIALLEHALGSYWSAPRIMRLTRMEERLFAALYKRGFVSKEAAWESMYYDAHGEYPEEKILDVRLCKVRAKAKPFGIVIKTVHARGWEMAQDSRLIVDRLLDEQAATLPAAFPVECLPSARVA